MLQQVARIYYKKSAYLFHLVVTPTKTMIMSDENLLDYKGIVERMAEEAGVKSLRKLDSAIGTPESYVYAMIERGISKGYWEKFITEFPNADFTYIITGKRSQSPRNTREAVVALISELSRNASFANEMTREYDAAIYEVSQDLSREEYLEDVLRFVLRLLSTALEKES